jgi:hypothetical protein
MVVLLGFGLAAPLAAQELTEQPITRYVVDIRGALPKVPADDALASPYGLTGAELPGFGLGLDVSAQYYPLRWRRIALGVGVNAVLGRAHVASVTADDGTVTGKDTTATFTAASPQISLNFGNAAGWSYLSGGIGLSSLAIRTPETPASQRSPRVKTIDYGGGGRWFLWDRMAFTFDIRFYAINPIQPDVDVYRAPRMKMVVVSVGLSFR